MQGENFIFFGVAGSGKGTQIKLLMELLRKRNGQDTVYAYPGAEYRRLIESKSFSGSLVEGVYNRGELLPGVITDSIVGNILISSLTEEKNLIADGYPREVTQSESFLQMLRFYKRTNIKIIYIELSEDEAMKRNLLRGRADDTKEVIHKRFEEYKNKVLPAMNYFKGKDGFTIFTINGEQSVEDVERDIKKALGY